MQRYIVGRLIQTVVSLLVVSIVVFGLVRLSGDPTALFVPLDARSSQADIDAFRAEFGLDRPLHEQYIMFVSKAVQGDFGRSIRFRRPAIELVLERLPSTIQLGVVAMLFAVAVAVPIGVYSAVKRGTGLDYAARMIAALGQAVPAFWLGLVLVLVFGVVLRLLPTSGGGGLAHLILPAITLGWVVVAGLMRLTRSSMLDVLGSEFVKLARIKGLPEYQVVWKHAFKNAVLPVLTLAALLFVNLLGGSIIVEAVFAWPGVGTLILEAVTVRDYPVVQAVVLILSALYLLVNLVVDILYAYLNPKIRYS